MRPAGAWDCSYFYRVARSPRATSVIGLLAYRGCQENYCSTFLCENGVPLCIVNCSSREQRSVNIACMALCHLWQIALSPWLEGGRWTSDV